MGNRLTEIIIPKNVENIGDSAYCENYLSSVIIRNGVVRMSVFVF